jgi:hypothetical protein
MSNHGRRGAFAIAATLALALLVPGTALAGHDLVIYKQEAHVDLSADELATSVSCNPGDHALDGMWRIDHADQDDYVAPLELISGAVDVLSAYPSSDSTYTFSFVKNAIGRAQVKIFVTCLANKTSGDAHQHTFSSVAAPPQLSFTKADGLTPGFQTSAPTVVTGGAGLLKTVANATPCPTGFRLVSPGFSTANYKDNLGAGTDPSAGVMRMYRSISSNGSDWQWAWENTALPQNYTTELTTYSRCLKIKVPQNGFDKHKLVFKFNHPKTFNPAMNKVSEGQYNCGDAYKAIVAGFTIGDNDGGTGGAVVDVGSYAKDGTGLLSTPPSASAFNNVFYLGMDPRPKQRAYRFANRSTTRTYDVILRALCLNYRTT